MDDNLDAALEDLKHEFIDSARRNIEKVLASLQALEQDPADRPALEAIRHLFHRLAGSGGTYGMPVVSEIGMACEQRCLELLESNGPAKGGDVAAWRGGLQEVEQEFERASIRTSEVESTVPQPEQASVPAMTREVPGDVLLISAQTPPHALLEVTRRKGVQVQRASEPPEIDRLLRSRALCCIVVDLDLDGAQALVAQLAKRMEVEGLPVVALLDRVTPAGRVALTLLGVSHFLPPDSGTEAMEPILEAALRGRVVRARLVMATDDDGLAERVRGCAGPWVDIDRQASLENLLARVNEISPDVVVAALNGDEEQVSATVREIRAQSAMLGSGLLVMVPEHVAGARRVLLSAGADDVLERDDDQALRSALRFRLRAARLLRERGQRLPPLRRAPQSLPAPAAPATAAVESTGVRVLVADDDSLVRRVLERHMNGLGWDVVAAEDGEQAEAELKRERFDLVLLDVLMPFHSGFDLLEWIKNDAEHPPRRIVMLTALRQNENVLRAFELGADDFIAKPFNPKVVIERLKRLVQTAP